MTRVFACVSNVCPPYLCVRCVYTHVREPYTAGWLHLRVHKGTKPTSAASGVCLPIQFEVSVPQVLHQQAGETGTSRPWTLLLCLLTKAVPFFLHPCNLTLSVPSRLGLPARSQNWLPTTWHTPCLAGLLRDMQLPAHHWRLQPRPGGHGGSLPGPQP